jgi:Zn-finger nucleic acid-binding protein
MQCPTCELELVRGKYAGANVRECTGCQGALLATTRAAKIERRVNKDVPELVKEVANTTASDTDHKIRCPSCRAEMEKRQIKQLGLSIDDCHQCGMSWFDGGELAALQLCFEKDPQTVELNRMRERLSSMTEEERLEYEANISKLKDLGSSLGQAIRGATFDLTSSYYGIWMSR